MQRPNINVRPLERRPGWYGLFYEREGSEAGRPFFEFELTSLNHRNLTPSDDELYDELFRGSVDLTEYNFITFPGGQRIAL